MALVAFCAQSRIETVYVVYRCFPPLCSVMAMLGALMPTDATMVAWGTLEDVRAWAAVPNDLWVAWKTALGDVNLQNLATTAGLDPTGVVQATLNLQWDAGAGMRGINLIEVSRIQLGFNAVRAKFRMDLVPFQAAPPQAPLQPQGLQRAHTYGAIDPLLKVRLATTVDQACDAEIQLLSRAEIAARRDRLKLVLSGDPLDVHNFSDAQISAFSKKMDTGAPPYVDFAIWGPYGNRTERRCKFEANFRDTQGNWKTVELPGPADFTAWEASWEVFKSAAIAENVASLATLTRYAAEFKSRVVTYPGCWHLAVEADVLARSEQMVTKRRELEVLHAKNPALSDFDPGRPWDEVFRAMAKDRDFWNKMFEQPAMRYQLSNPPRAVPNFSMTGGLAQGSSFQTQADGGGGHPNPKVRKEKFKKPKGPGGPGGGPKGAGKGGNEEKRKDGRFLRGRNGADICYTFSRDEGGCSETCPQKRLHICEFCRGQHRTIHCPTHPGWTAPPVGGKGKK